MGLQGLRNVAHFGSQICWTIAITLLPFATVFALEFTIPAWVTLLAVLFLGERMSTSRALALALCVVGVVVILRPGHEAFQPAALIMLVGALLFAIAAIATKKLITTETTFSIMLWMNLMQLPLNFVGSDPASFFKLDASLDTAADRDCERGAGHSLLPRQRVPLRRRHGRDPAGFPARAADRADRLDVLRRAHRCVRVRRGRADLRGRAVELARGDAAASKAGDRARRDTAGGPAAE
jgi:hypothetical protein